MGDSTHEEGSPVRIALFSTCLADVMFPQAAQATVTLLERLGHEVVFPEDQVCCGQMHANTGYFEDAAKITRNHVKAFEPVLDGVGDQLGQHGGQSLGSVRVDNAERALQNGADLPGR